TPAFIGARTREGLASNSKKAGKQAGLFARVWVNGGRRLDESGSALNRRRAGPLLRMNEALQEFLRAGFAWRREHLLWRAFFDDSPFIKEADAIRYLLGELHFVGDQQHGQVLLLG